MLDEPDDPEEAPEPEAAESEVPEAPEDPEAEDPEDAEFEPLPEAVEPERFEATAFDPNEFVLEVPEEPEAVPLAPLPEAPLEAAELPLLEAEAAFEDCPLFEAAEEALFLDDFFVLELPDFAAEVFRDALLLANEPPFFDFREALFSLADFLLVDLTVIDFCLEAEEA